MKKFISVLMALALMVTLCPAVFAADSDLPSLTFSLTCEGGTTDSSGAVVVDQGAILTVRYSISAEPDTTIVNMLQNCIFYNGKIFELVSESDSLKEEDKIDIKDDKYDLNIQTVSNQNSIQKYISLIMVELNGGESYSSDNENEIVEFQLKVRDDVENGSETYIKNTSYEAYSEAGKCTIIPQNLHIKIGTSQTTNNGNETGSNNNYVGGGGGGGTVNYTLTYNTNGGTEITRDRVSAGTAVDLTGKVTTRDAYDFDGWYTDEQLTTPVSGNTFTVTANTTLYAKWKAKTISGDVTAPDDGSVTVTETDEATGTVTATTTWPDGSTRVTVTTTDGTATRTDTKANGITAVTVTDKDGNTVSAEANIPSDVAAAAASAITVPVEVKPAGSSDSAGTVKINIENNGSAKVEIPVTGVTNGTVALLLNEDGTEELLKDSVVTSDGLIVSVSGGSASFKIIDNTKRFDDVETSDWFNDAVMYAASREIMNGTSSNQFSPDVNMTRGMLAQVLYNYENKPDTDAENIFNDVGDTAWYADAVTWAADKGVVTGYGDGVFAPEQNITREQLATMLWRYAGKPAAAEQTVSFSDLDQVSSYASEAIAWATSNGILNGKGNNILDPKGYATRAQVAQMLKNFIAIQ